MVFGPKLPSQKAIVVFTPPQSSIKNAGPQFIIPLPQTSSGYQKLRAAEINTLLKKIEGIVNDPRYLERTTQPRMQPELRRAPPPPRMPPPPPRAEPSAAPPPAPEGRSGPSRALPRPVEEEKHMEFQASLSKQEQTSSSPRLSSMPTSRMPSEHAATAAKQPLSNMPTASPTKEASILPSKKMPDRGFVFPSLGGFSKEQLTHILKEVTLASFVYTSQEKQVSAQKNQSFVQTVFLMQKLVEIQTKLTTAMQSIHEEAHQQEKVLPQQIKMLLETVVKELHEIERQLQEEPTHSTQTKQSQTETWQQIITLKNRTEELLTKMQAQIDDKLLKLAEKAQKQSPQQALEPQANIASKKEMPLRPNMPLSQGIAPAAMQPMAKGAVPASVSTPLQIGEKAVTMSPPQFIQNTADLLQFAEKAQKKEMQLPVQIALAYPLGQKTSDNLVQVQTNTKGGDRSGLSYSQYNEKVQEMVLIPSGPSLVRIVFPGESNPEFAIMDMPDFLMGAYPITNAQYANWLNEMYVQAAIQLSKKGVVLDLHQNVLCNTRLSSKTSQIEVTTSEEQLLFSPIKGTERHPITEVSALGATAYCQSYHFKLPSEAEWEKAAGIPVEPSLEFLNYSLYGFGKDILDPSLANYRDELQEYGDNRTTPVGFYNGETIFTKQGKNFQSKNASSFLGCYDMSGNVYEWTRDMEKNYRIVKGGSYNSAPEELLITASKLLDPHVCYPDTGFRVAFDI